MRTSDRCGPARESARTLSVKEILALAPCTRTDDRVQLCQIYDGPHDVAAGDCQERRGSNQAGKVVMVVSMSGPPSRRTQPPAAHSHLVGALGRGEPGTRASANRHEQHNDRRPARHGSSMCEGLVSGGGAALTASARPEAPRTCRPGILPYMCAERRRQPGVVVVLNPRPSSPRSPAWRPPLCSKAGVGRPSLVDCVGSGGRLLLDLAWSCAACVDCPAIAGPCASLGPAKATGYKEAAGGWPGQGLHPIQQDYKP